MNISLYRVYVEPIKFTLYCRAWLRLSWDICLVYASHCHDILYKLIIINYVTSFYFKTPKDINVLTSLFQTIQPGIESSSHSLLYSMSYKELPPNHQHCSSDHDCTISGSHCGSGVHTHCFHGLCYCLGKIRN